MTINRRQYTSKVAVYRFNTSLTDTGTSKATIQKINTICDALLGTPGEMMCRLDLQFIRIGKDVVIAPKSAGQAPARQGVLFFDVPPVIDAVRAGDLLHCEAGPVIGWFGVTGSPDVAVGFRAEHMEAYVVEHNKELTPNVSDRPWPASQINQ